VVPAKPARGEKHLPPHPDDVPLPKTFGQWYRVASTNLGLAERVDLGLSRILAGGALVLLQFAGLFPAAVLLAVVLGAPLARPAPMMVGAGGALLVGTWLWWAWYRRDWARAWELRRAWSWAINGLEVLALPAESRAPGVEHDIDTDPEGTHPYRARELFPIAARPFIGRVIVPGGLWSDRVRGREALRYWLLTMTAAVLTIYAMVVAIYLWGGVSRVPLSEVHIASVTMAIALLPPPVFACARLVRRLLLAHNLAQVESSTREKWIEWQERVRRP
jgi:hypothetical protein